MSVKRQMELISTDQSALKYLSVSVDSSIIGICVVISSVAVRIVLVFLDSTSVWD